MPAPWHPTTPPVNASTLPAVLAAHRVVVLHLWAEWNLHDRRMDAYLQELRPLYADQIAFYSFDVDSEDGWSLLREWNPLNLPALICFIGGQKWDMMIGLGSVERVNSKLQEWCAAPSV